MKRQLIAILRGLTRERALPIAETLIDAGFDMIEIPVIGTPMPFDSIAAITKRFGRQATIGAGSVTTVADIQRLKEEGGQFAVSPHFDVQIAKEAHAQGIKYIPGIVTPTEYFAATQTNISGIKIFPADMMGLDGLRSLRTLMVKDLPIYIVGGITADKMLPWLQAGADGFGLGQSLFAPNSTRLDVAIQASQLVEAYDHALAKQYLSNQNP